jgi:hypothetical protein
VPTNFQEKSPWSPEAAAASDSARNSSWDAKVLYVDTTGWLTVGSSDYDDAVHPSVSGHIKTADLLRRILEPYLIPK